MDAGLVRPAPPPTASQMTERPGFTRIAIFMLSLAVLLLQIAYTRIFSFSLWYHFTYVALTVALLGYGASGAFLSASAWLSSQPPAALMVRSMLLAAVGVLISLLTILFIPLQPFSIGTSFTQLFLMLLFFVLCSAPYFAAGLAMACAFRSARSPNDIYFADLLGAGAGCAVAVGAIWLLGSPGAAVASASIFVCAALVVARPERRIPYAMAGIMVTAGCAAAVTLVPFRPSGEKLLAKMMAAGVTPFYSRWSPIFRVDVYPGVGEAGARRGVSQNYTGPVPGIRFIAHDGTAEAPIYQFSGNLAELDFLERNVSATPYVIANRPRTLVIGLGGGFDVLNALRNGARHVTGVELDPVTVDVVRNRQAEFAGNLLSRPDVDVVTTEGRSFLRHSSATYDVIQLTGVDTLAALSTGAYMLAESYLYTVEAFEEYLQHLSADGTLSLMIGDLHWRGGQARFSLRHVMNFIGAAERAGIADPASHTAIIATPGGVPMIELLFKPRPFTDAEISTLRDFAASNGFEIWHLPGVNVDTPHSRLLTADAAERERLLDTQPLNVAATGDDRPFFFHFYRWRDLLSPARWEVDTGHAGATGQLVLAAILVVATVAALGLIVVPLLTSRRLRRPGTFGFATYFAALGLGFMFIEISLIQRFILFLGHPTYSVAIILLALLVSTGIGSFASGRLSLAPRRIIHLGFATLVALIVCYAWIVPLLFSQWLGTPAAFRYASTVVGLMPLGLILGVFFPAGLREVRERDELLVPWAWGANGGASVVGSILSIVLAISFGFRTVLFLAAAVYCVGVLALPAARSEGQVPGGAH
ncbi:hypothetical protein L6Q96_17930 [Candidatus Binatia bacterium]|nr:hypothetical protein [Candidatus Binatia bacterium]